MPVSCSTSVLTGQEGSIYFKPAGTSFCLVAADFPGGTSITVPADNDYRVGDPVSFTAVGNGASLDGQLTQGTVYYVVAVPTTTSISISATVGGGAITLDGDTVTPEGTDINIKYAEFAAICQVRQFDLSIEREALDTTVLPCGVSGDSSKWASFRRTQSGFANGTGSMTVYFTADQESLANRLLSNVLLKTQDGAEVQLFVNTVSDGSGGVDLSQSLYVESEISLQSMSLSVNPDDPTSAEVSYTIVNPKVVLGANISG